MVVGMALTSFKDKASWLSDQVDYNHVIHF